jgi:hypothetical protein
MKSNTELEVETTLDRLQRERKITFLSYFRKLPSNVDAGKQEKRVVGLRKTLHKKDIWFCNYDSPAEFKERLTHDLYKTVIKIQRSTNRNIYDYQKKVSIKYVYLRSTEDF